MARWVAIALTVAACGGGTVATSSSTTAATSSQATTMAATTTSEATTIPTVTLLEVSIPPPLPIQMLRFDDTPDPRSGFSLSLFVGSPLRAAVGAARGFPAGCVELAFYADGDAESFFEVSVPLPPGGCEPGVSTIDAGAILAHTDRSLVIELGDLPETRFIPVLRVFEPGGGWYSKLVGDSIDPAVIPAVAPIGYFTHFGGGLFVLPNWTPVDLPEPVGGDCEPDDTVLCVDENQFEVEAEVSGSGAGTSEGNGTVLMTAGGDGLFYFFEPNHVEALIKVVNACALNNRYWVFFAAITNVEIDITVTDTASGEIRTYRNIPPVQPINDSDAFSTCPD